ncbi:M24 family metallopeptidase [Xylocopilactobacillus apicola]|uniref:Peptidase M24 n=1 Tax=Xylocopilactobacillus apicola TaxID=2932184 RepID=A0AAU9DIE0_9LACO|nr:Xaa-Pro peptidase family protein [Xylocopilactobacillus apicola]BDR58141.1 peptidase M24 [Xylocopilactobacillus apicola]
MEQTHLKDFQSWLSLKSIEGALLLNPVNVSYFTGFTGDESYLFVTPSEALFITDSRYLSQVKAEVRGVAVEQNQKGLTGVISLIHERFPLNDLGLELSYVSASDYLTIKKKILCPVIDIGAQIDSLRQVKDEEEINCIKKACAIADQAFMQVLTEIKPGMTELMVASKLESHFKELGSTGPSFETIVAAGIRSSMPHGSASTNVIKSGDLVTLDFGCFYEGYTSDLTRTIGVGKISKDQQEIYDIVLKANEETIKILRQGVTGAEMHEKAHNIIDSAGYQQYFGHGTGHGIGRSIHEGPGAWGGYQSQPVVSGNIITIEPGIYLPDRFGVRIEDDVLINDQGYEVLTKSPKNELIII